MRTTNVELAKLVPPPTRPYADPVKVARLGPFDWTKYQPIEVEIHGGRLVIQSGMTRVEIAQRAGITHLPAFVFPKSGA